MHSQSIRIDRFTFPCAIKSCSALVDLRLGRQLHLQAFLLGFSPDLFVASSLVDVYSKCSELGDARKVFDETPNRNAVVLTSMIVGLILNDAAHKAVVLFKEFLDGGGEELDAVTAVAALSACARVPRKGLTGGNTLTDAYAKCGDLGVARTVFDGMEEKDVVSWNTIMAVYMINGLSTEALRLYRETVWDDSAQSSVVTFSTVMLACAHSGSLQFGKCVHNQAIRMGLEDHLHVGTSTVSRENSSAEMKFLFQCPCCSCFCFMKTKQKAPKEKETKGE